MGRDEMGAPYRQAEAALDTRADPTRPLIIRVDGRAFSNLSRHFMNRPFDDVFVKTMDEVAHALAWTLEGACCAYVQSDEVSVVMSCPRETDPWFDWRIQKVTTCAAATASVAFARAMAEAGRDRERYAKAASWMPTFDARALQVDPDDVVGYLAWRQTDARRNAVSQAAYARLGSEKVKGMSTRQMRDALESMGDDPNAWPQRLRDGALVIRQTYQKTGENPLTGESRVVTRRRWETLERCPDFAREKGRTLALLGLEQRKD